MDKFELQKLIKECVSDCILEQKSRDIINENLQIEPVKLKQAFETFVNNLISSDIFSSYHRNLTSGDMDPKDFANDLVHKLLSSTQEWIKLVNDRGNWENDEGGMIKEVSCKSCGNKCDPSILSEVVMGAVECPHCKSIMDQEGNVYGRRI